MGIKYQLLDGVGVGVRVGWGMFDMFWALGLLVWAGDIRGWQVVDPHRIYVCFLVVRSSHLLIW
ncbi:hypothetical protein Hanom_Chr15g01410901 [Helianthus anomalus]